MASRWGLGRKKWGNIIRFLLFSTLHVVNFVVNLVLIYCLAEYTGISHNPHQRLLEDHKGYFISLVWVMFIVGIYCTRLAWVDADISRWSKEWCGPVGRFFVCLSLGMTQLIQIKVAFAKFLRRRHGLQAMLYFDDENEDEGGRSAAARAQAQRMAVLEDTVPWTFPSKCIEGIVEGTVFSIVALYALLKADWKDESHHTHWDPSYSWCAMLSGFVSFMTVAVSVLNFDYHLSQAVAKTCDHSIRYTFIHFMFRGAEVCSRIMQIVLFLLAFRACPSSKYYMRAIPYFVMIVDYMLCVGMLFAVSMHEERRYRDLNGIGGTCKRVLSACLMSGA